MISVLIVNWNAGHLLARCLESLPAAMGGLAWEAIVVDNASTDDSLNSLPDLPWLSIVQRPDNPGFAVATNQAASLASGDLLLLLNPDTECRPGSVRRMADFLAGHADIAALGPCLVHSDGRPQRSAWRGFPGLGAALVDALYLWKWPALPGVRRSETAPASPGDSPRDVDHLLGACMLMPRAAWEAVGPLDEGYFLFLEETDWCRRARAAGLRVVQLPAAEVMHHGEHSVLQVPERSSAAYYLSYLRFRRGTGDPSAHIVLLKCALGLGIVTRLGLWGMRLLGPRRTLAAGMIRGYLRALPAVMAG